jgi:lipopolysaccharide assembly outer membrane protein LptD (OstA)
MFNFSNFILNLQVNVRITHQNDNFYSKDHEDNFEERHHPKDKFRVVYFEMILNHKSIID